MKEDLKIKNNQIKDLIVSKQELDKILGSQQDKQLQYTSFGSMVLAGISLLFVPFIFKE